MSFFRWLLQFGTFENFLHAATVFPMELHRRLFICCPRRLVSTRSVLVHQMSVFRSTSHTEVLHLHHFGQNRLIEMILQGRSSVIAFEHVLVLILKRRRDQFDQQWTENELYHEEGTTMVIFLEIFVFPFRCFVGDDFRILLQFSQPFLFGHVVPTFEFLLFTFTPEGKQGRSQKTSRDEYSLVTFFPVAFQPFQFAQFPGIVSSFLIFVVRVEITLNAVVCFFLFQFV